jgi:peptidoglycan/xylan/chitin deacetylase (PgdA/CDA1 family)
MFRGVLCLLVAGAALTWPAGGDGRLPDPGRPRRMRGTSLASARLTPPASERPKAPPAPFSPSYPTHLQPLPGMPPSSTSLPFAAPSGPPRRELVLTFDDGPDLFLTPLVLEALDRRGYKAIFFVNGRALLGHRPQDLARRDLVRKLAAHGHLVANHGLIHRNVCAQPEQLEAEIDGNAEIIHGVTGLRPLLFRAPYGARCKRLDEAAAARDLIQVGWNLDPQEWKGGGEDAIVDYVRSMTARPGRYILLLHDLHREAARAVPRILDWIDRENERAARTGAPPIVIRDYTVFLRPQPVPATGLEPLLDGVKSALDLLEGWTRA